MAAGHLPGLVAQLEGLLSDGAVGVGADVVGGDDDGGHGLDGSIGGRRIVAGADGAEVAGLDLGELLEEALEAGAHEEVGHALGQRAEAGSGVVVVEALEAAGGVAGPRRARPRRRGVGRRMAGATALRGGGASICSRKPPSQPGQASPASPSVRTNRSQL